MLEIDNGNNPGFGSDLPYSQNRGASDSIRVFALDPAIAAAEVERALSKFDARWINSITWNKVDNPALNFQASFQNGDGPVVQPNEPMPAALASTARCR